jgi:hypothetical protein
MSPAKIFLRIKFASMLASSLLFAGPGIAQEGIRRPIAPSNNVKQGLPANQTNKPKTSPNNGRKAKVAQPVRNHPSRVASIQQQEPAKSDANSHDPESEKEKLVLAACKNCTPVRIADDPMEIRHEEPVTGLSPSLNDPETFRFQENDCNTRNRCGADQIATFGVLGLMLRNMQLKVEAATFWGDSQVLQPLVTTRRPANDPATDGLIGRTDTIALFGGREQLADSEQGIRGELGLFFDPCQSRGLLFRYFDVSTEVDRFNSAGSIDPVVVRPFFSTADNAQSTIAINYPNSTSGAVNASLSSDVYGGDVLFRKMLRRDCSSKIELLAGYQMARLDEQLTIASTTTALTNTPAPTGTVSQLTDEFTTSNRFHATTFGLNTMLREGCWNLNGMVKLGFGNLERQVNIQGSSLITVPGNPPTSNATSNGLLARSTNDGRYQLDTFIVSPEVALTLGYRFSRNLDATLSYTYLGIPKVARAGDQLDPQLASNLSSPLNGQLTPRFSLAESNFSLHSLSYGLQWQY